MIPLGLSGGSQNRVREPAELPRDITVDTGEGAKEEKERKFDP